MTREEWLRQEIATYKKRVETFLAMIAEWERELASDGGPMRPPAPADTPISNKKKLENGQSPAALVQGMVFFNKSQPEASKAFLEMVGYPLTTPQIIEGIERGGVRVGGQTTKAKKMNLYTILHRSPDFALVGKDTWGLTGWPGVPKKTTEESDKGDDKEEKAKEA